MPKLLTLLVLIWVAQLQAQNLTPEEQRQLLNDVKDMKAKINKLEGKSEPTGLKRVNYENATSESKEASTAPAASLSPEDSKKLMDDISAIKLKQIESQKILEELDKDE